MLLVVKTSSFTILRIPGLKMMPVFKGSLFFFTMAFNLSLIMLNFARLLQNLNYSQKAAVFTMIPVTKTTKIAVFKIISKTTLLIQIAVFKMTMTNFARLLQNSNCSKIAVFKMTDEFCQATAKFRLP